MTRPDDASPWPRVEVGRDVGRARREWLHTGGAGAYASSTLAGTHTRRYHGLLVAALDAPCGRHVMVSHVDASLEIPDPSARRAARQRWDLAKHQFPSVDPEATPFYLARFDQDPLPRWTYEVAGGTLEVTLALVRGENAIALRYAWRGPQPVLLKLRPLLAVRHLRLLLRENGGMSQRVEMRAGADLTTGEVRVQPNTRLPRVCFRYQGTFVGSPDWWRRFEYLAERDRGLDFQEDLWTPGHFETPLGAEPAWFVAAVGALPAGEPEALLAASRAALLGEDPGPGRPPLERWLAVAAGAFRCDGAARPGVVAGYPWFEVLARDTLMALPGLYLVPGKVEGAMRVVRELIHAMKDGLLPSRPADASGPADAPSAEATLWLFEAARLMADQLGDTHAFVTDELLLALRDAFEAVQRGTRGVHVTPDGLFAAARDGAAPTSQDARPRTPAVPPRAGCPVELTALWARGTDTLSRLARAAGDHGLAERAQAAARAARAAFHARFWCEETGYCYDVISEEASGDGAFRDGSVRPHALVALAIDPGCFSGDRAVAILDRVRLELLTPAGVRTLSPADPAYLPRYRRALDDGDGAYRQGTVWPGLLGFYVRAAKRSSSLGEHVVPLLHRLIASAAENEAVLGQVPEVADAEPPHHPGGGFAQAWSVAELLRALVWDLREDPPGQP